jgi:hypothetical protein
MEGKVWYWHFEDACFIHYCMLSLCAYLSVISVYLTGVHCSREWVHVLHSLFVRMNTHRIADEVVGYLVDQDEDYINSIWISTVTLRSQ